MKDKMFIGIIGTIGGISMACSIQTIYNFYVLPVIRHREVMDKIDGFDNRLKKVENTPLLRSEMKKSGHVDV
jgi:hypothetical protein